MVSSLDYNAPWPIYALSWSNSAPTYHSPTSTSSLSRHSSIQSNDPNSRYLPPSSPATAPPRRLDNLSDSSSSNSNSSNSTSTPTGLPPGSRLAIGSFLEEYSNRIQVVGPSTYINSKGNKSSELKLLADASHPYPATKLAFQPNTLADSSVTHTHGGGGNSNLHHSNSTGSNHGRSYVSPTTKFAKRTSWGVGTNNTATSPTVPNINSPNTIQEELDYYPDRELLASTADCLRIWEIHRQDSNEENSETSGKDHSGGTASNRSSYVGKGKNDGLPFALREKSVLAHSKSSASPPAPLTSFSWNAPSPNLIVTASIDTTCTIWDLPTRTALTQLIAHDREVYDVDWCPGSADVFASVGADGSVRVFDLRSLEHSTIIYEMASTQTGSGSGSGAEYAGQSSSTASGGLAIPLLRISFNPWDANYLATFHLESQAIQILDVRAPGSPILELRGHSGAVNAVSWGPPGSSNGWSGSNNSGPSKGMVATGGDDNQCLVYDLATSTLRSASAQGRRSRNGNTPQTNNSSNHSTNPSPAPSSNYSNTTSPNPNSIGGGSRIGVENPILATSLPDMVNNVSWLRLNPNSINGGAGYGGGNHHHSGSQSSSGYGERRDSRDRNSVVQEWDEYNTGNGNKDEDRDWLAMTSGNLVRAMRV